MPSLIKILCLSSAFLSMDVFASHLELWTESPDGKVIRQRGRQYSKKTGISLDGPPYSRLNWSDTGEYS